MKIALAPFYIISATFIGIADTLYLSYFHYMNLIPSCAIGGCEIVLTSVYSSPFGVPFAYIGLFYYASMLGLALLLAYDPYSRGLRLGMLVYAGLGFVLSIGFELFQYFVIHALCMYCAISALTTLALLCLAIWHWKASK